MRLVDTNVFVRYLTKDDPRKAKASLNLLQKAKTGKVELYTTESAISEVVYVLESDRLYNLGKEEIVNMLLPILNIGKLKIVYKTSIIVALKIYEQSLLDFEDALLVAHAFRLNAKEIYTYDKGFDKIQGIKRLEP
mgnify:CR=1 FL=1